MNAYGPLAGWYDPLTGDVPYEAFADYYEKLFKQRGLGVSSVLDLACGTGSLSRILAERGYDVTAVDASPDMLAEAASKCSGLENPPLLLCQSLQELDLYGASDVALCSLDGMNYLPPEALPEVFRRLRCFIEPGGILIFDILTPQRLRSLSGGIFADESEDMFCVWRADMDEEENALVYGVDIFSRKGRLWRRDTEEHTEYLHQPETLLRLLTEAGFLRAELHGDGPQSELGRVFLTAENRNLQESGK